MSHMAPPKNKLVHYAFCKKVYLWCLGNKLKFMKRFLVIIFFLSVTYFGAMAQEKPLNPDYKAYIDKYKNVAVREMLLYHIPASITLSQGIIESNCGKSPLAKVANNHFGIKCQKEWTGETFLFDDDKEQECFRKYKNADESYRDHSVFLTTRQRYAELFSLQITDYKGWARGLSKCGYATNPNYPDILIRVIEDCQLYRFDDTSNQEQLAGNDDSVERADNQSSVEERNDALPVLFRQSYKMPSPSEFKLRSVSKLGRKVYENNGIPFIFALRNDTWHSIAKEFGIYSFQIYRQNDLADSDAITEGQILYLEPKKRQASVSSCVMGESDCMYSISQRYGIKMSYLYKYNDLQPGDEPVSGTTIYLRKK
jgi:hypothetical protein